jgi:phospholipid transport system substrate-binding protein
LLVSRVLAASLLLCVAVLGAGAARAAGPTPTEVVERLNAALIEVMREADALGFQGRYERLAPVLSAAFDFPLMARISAGKHWRAWDAVLRARFVAAFGNTSIATYAARFDGYGGERFEVLGEQRGRRETVLVRNHLVKSDGAAVAIDYLLKAGPGDSKDGWRVVDVFLDGKFSELALKRSEYGAVIKNDGVETLIRGLGDQAARLAAEN